MNSVFILSLKHKKLGGIKIEIVEEQELVFEGRDVLENWLREQGFVYGHCNEFKNTPGKFYWFHQNDRAYDSVEVTIKEMFFSNQNTVPDEWINNLGFREKY